METVTFCRWSLAVIVGTLVLLACQASATGPNINVGSCLKTCEATGCAGSSCLPSCHYSKSNATRDALMLKLPVYVRWKEWICSTECSYHCMLSKDAEEAGLDQEAIGYRHNWCVARSMVHQEPASAVVSVLNLVGNLIGFLTFLKFVHYSLPSRPISHGPYYPFAGLWTIYGLLSTVYWLAQCIMRSRNLAFDKHVDATFEVILATYALSLAVVRVGDMRSEQARVVVLATTLPFLVPHLMYINLCTFDYGLNILVCLLLSTIQYVLWITWAVVTKHPAQFQLWSLALVAPASLFFRMYDFSYLVEVLDPDTLWIVSAVPASFMWWSFARSDAAYQTKLILKTRAEMLESVDSKKVQQRKQRLLRYHPTRYLVSVYEVLKQFYNLKFES